MMSSLDVHVKIEFLRCKHVRYYLSAPWHKQYYCLVFWLYISRGEIIFIYLY